MNLSNDLNKNVVAITVPVLFSSILYEFWGKEI